MIIISDEDRCVSIWGIPKRSDIASVLRYQAQGYTVVLLHNGTEDAKGFIRAVANAGAAT